MVLCRRYETCGTCPVLGYDDTDDTDDNAALLAGPGTTDPIDEMGARNEPLAEIPGLYDPEPPYREPGCDRVRDAALTFAGSVTEPPEIGRVAVPHETFDPTDETASTVADFCASGVEVRLEAFPVMKPPYDMVAVPPRGVPASDDCCADR